jgi:hypothetical protein
VNVEIAKAGGLFKSKFGKSHGVGLADAILAATAEAENAELKRLKFMKAKEFDKKFDSGESIVQYLELERTARPGQEQRRVNAVRWASRGCWPCRPD